MPVDYGFEWTKHADPPPKPGSEQERLDLCGWAGADAALDAMQELGPSMPEFEIMGQTESSAGKSARLWLPFIKVTGHSPDTTPQPTGNSFPEDTLILMADGSECPIQDVEVGDWVISSVNKPRKVTRTFNYQFDGTMVTLQAETFGRSLSATAEHLIPHFPNRKKRKDLRHSTVDDIEWVTAESLDVGDAVLIPRGIPEQGEYVSLDLERFNTYWNSGPVTAGCIQDPSNTRGMELRRKYQLPKTIAVDENFGRLIGLYLAEGGCTDSSVRFYFATNETETLVKETRELLDKVFGLPSTQTVQNDRGSVTMVCCNSSALREFIKELVPGNTWSKEVPAVIQRSPEAVRFACFKAWMDGDGCFRRNPHGQSWKTEGKTVSERLADGLMQLGISCGLQPARTVSYQPNRAPTHTIRLAGCDTHRLYPDVTPETSREFLSKHSPSGLALYLCRSEHSIVSQTVYCLEVDEDHSFIANGYAVHNCVAAAADDVIEGTQCFEILAGDAEKFRPIYNPYHYATGRVIIGKNRLRGGAGSIGSWQSQAIERHGVIPLDQEGLPKYNRSNVDAWGDDKAAGGKSFRDYLEQGGEHLIRTTAFADTWEKLRDALFNGYLATIASNRGYTMSPGNDGMHHPSGSWSHQMSKWGYSEEGPEKDWWAAIKNQWGNVHGTVRTPQGDELPPGFLLVPLMEFIEKHLLLRGCECIAYSRFDGFPDQQKKKVEYDFAW